MQTFKSNLRVSIYKNLQMTWIYQQCKDQVGHCIRQYSFFGLSIIIAILALISFIKTLKSQHRFNFEVLPLAINTFTSVAIVGIYFRIQEYNTRLVLFVVQLYSYFILCYGFISMVMKQSSRFADMLKRLKIIFVVTTVVSLVAVAVLITLGLLGELSCSQNQGIGAIIMTSLELPLIFFTYYFSHKCKQLLQKQQTFHLNGSYNNPSLVTKHLILQEDYYLKLKKLQLNLVRLALFITFALHLTQILSYYIADSTQLCVNKILTVSNGFEIFILCVENVSQLFPHFIIPFIFWYLPNKIAARSKTIFLSQGLNLGEIINNLGNQKQNEVPKLKMQKHPDSQFYNDMHSEQSIRQKLLPKTKEQRTSTL